MSVGRSVGRSGDDTRHPTLLTREGVLSRTGVAGSERVDHWHPCSSSQSMPADMIVGQGGLEDLQQAIDLVVSNAVAEARRRWHIVVQPGRYRGPVRIPEKAPPLTITATGDAVLAAAIDAEMPGSEFAQRFGFRLASNDTDTRAWFGSLAVRNTLSTGHTAVLRIERDDTVVRGLTVVNDYDCNRIAAAPPDSSPDTLGRFANGQHQAVALHVAGADRVWLDRVRLSSFQDTLYLQHPEPFATARTLLTDCDIEGDVDFIFGQSTAYFDRCTLRARRERGAAVWYTAPATNLRSRHGFVFNECLFSADGQLPPDLPDARSRPSTSQPALLGRQWFEGVRATPYGRSSLPGYRCHPGTSNALEGNLGTITRATLEAVGKCRLQNCHFGPHLHPHIHWGDWNGGWHDNNGRYHDSPWNPRFRPVQRGPQDFLKYLGSWLENAGLDYHDIEHDADWLQVMKG